MCLASQLGPEYLGDICRCPGRKEGVIAMFVDASGSMGAEHARDLRRTAAALRRGRSGRRSPSLQHFLARGYLGPVDNYRVR